ncbi:NAD-dependent epimerase/dehydratase family protein [Nocardia noduli]|uniref:NAD-dependent epimerase/dehydratase family protein n=1 Tax=Nocardia noduli TaxID=2815722 RepID=UPI001C225B58|nr:NAD(P)-dependent oxidoreductase [Nocardia noduli]
MTVDTVLVTGAFGQVGRRCCETLLSRGRRVIALGRHTDTAVTVAGKLAGLALPGRLLPAYVDILDSAAVRTVVTEYRPDAIVHLAAVLAPVSYRNPGLARRINVEGTRNLVNSAQSLRRAPLLVEASSASVYGSRNPYRYPELITAETPVNPIDHYGEDKVLSEMIVRDSGLPYAVMRLSAVISPDGAAKRDSTYLLLMRALPRDNRLHAVDARDVGLAFANAVDSGERINAMTLLIAGDDSFRLLQRDLEDDLAQAVGLGRLGPSVALPGDPTDDRGWAFTGWFDTSASEALLRFQDHDWSDTLEWIAQSQKRSRTALLRALSPVLRPAIRRILAVQRRRDRRGEYADPWTLIQEKFGSEVLASTSIESR